MSSLDSSISEQETKHFLDKRKKVRNLRYIPDEYYMIKSRKELLDNLNRYLENKRHEGMMLDVKIDNERNIVQNRLVPEEWLNIEVYKECLGMDIENIRETYIEYIGLKYKKELYYDNGSWSSDTIDESYCNWLVSRCMQGDTFQIVLLDKKDKKIIDSIKSSSNDKVYIIND